MKCKNPQSWANPTLPWPLKKDIAQQMGNGRPAREAFSVYSHSEDVTLSPELCLLSDK